MGRNHTWSSWRERYKKNSVRFDELIKKIVEQGDHDQTMVYAYDKRPPFEHLVSRGGNDGLGRNREREEEEEEEEEWEEEWEEEEWEEAYDDSHDFDHQYRGVKRFSLDDSQQESATNKTRVRRNNCGEDEERVIYAIVHDFNLQKLIFSTGGRYSWKYIF